MTRRDSAAALASSFWCLTNPQPASFKNKTFALGHITGFSRSQ
jgi:hypothetical protein